MHTSKYRTMYILYIVSSPTTSFEDLHTLSEIYVKVDHTRGITKLPDEGYSRNGSCAI